MDNRKEEIGEIRFSSSRNRDFGTLKREIDRCGIERDQNMDTKIPPPRQINIYVSYSI